MIYENGMPTFYLLSKNDDSNRMSHDLTNNQTIKPSLRLLTAPTTAKQLVSIRQSNNKPCMVMCRVNVIDIPRVVLLQGYLDFKRTTALFPLVR